MMTSHKFLVNFRDVTEEETRRGGLDGPTIVVVNNMIRSISKIDDYKMVSKDLQIIVLSVKIFVRRYTQPSI